MKNSFKLWDDWPTESTCAVGVTDETVVHIRIGTLWCALFAGLACAALLRFK